MIAEELKRGIVSENPIFALALGLCPALAITTSVTNAWEWERRSYSS